MHMIYYSHSYRPPDKDINEFFLDLMLSEGLTPSLDPPSDHLNSAKPERHLRSTDGMIAVLTFREPEPSLYILYEIALCIRAQKPVLVFVEDVLPDGIVSSSLLQRRFSRKHYLREVRNHRHALRILKTYIGTEPPPSYAQNIGQRCCLVIGASSLPENHINDLKNHLLSLSYNPLLAPISNDCLSYASPYESLVAQSVLCIAFAEQLTPSEFYLLGSARATVTPTIVLSQNREFNFEPKVPKAYQARIIDSESSQDLCDTVTKEVNIFQEDYLELKEQEKVLRYRAALIQEGSSNGVYSANVRGQIVSIVNNIGEIDMSKDKISVSHVIGPVNIKSKLDNVAQIVNNASMMEDDKKREFAELIDKLHNALEAMGDQRPDDTERVVAATEIVAAEVAKSEPNKRYLKVTVEGLKEAAKAVKDIAPAVVAVASMIAKFVAGL